MNDDYMSMNDILAAISLFKYLYDNGKSDIVDGWKGTEFYYDYLPEIFYESMEAASQIVFICDEENYSADKWYFADSAMTEYYRLARKLCKLKGIGRKNDPYDKAARDFIKYADSNPGYAFDLFLRTGIRNEESSHILLYVYHEFNNPFDLAEFINSVFDFYREKLQEMKAEYERLTKPLKLCEQLKIPVKLEVAA